MNQGTKRRREVRLQFQCPAEAGGRFVQLALFLQGIAQVVVRLGIVRLQFQCPAAAGNRLVQLPLVLPRIAQVVVCLGKVRPQLQRPAVTGDCFVQLPQVLQRDTQVLVRLGVVRLQFRGPAEADDRFLRLSLVLQRKAQVIVRLGIVRLQFHCTVETCDRLGDLAQGTIRFPQVAMEGRRGPVQSDGTSYALHGRLVLARLMGDHAQKMHRIGLIRIEREDLPINLLGRLQPARLMVLDRDGQCFGNRCHAAHYDDTTRPPQCVFWKWQASSGKTGKLCGMRHAGLRAGSMR